MGGENEKPLRTDQSQAGKATDVLLPGGGRIHAERGKVHLHQGKAGDKTKLKTEVPTYVYHQRMLDWVQAGMQGPLIFIDIAAGTRCTITSMLNDAGDGFDTDVVWEKIVFSGNLKALIEHAEGK